jgi:hypothetical protein
MQRLFEDAREIGGSDPLDSEFTPRAPGIGIGRLDVLLRTRPALGLAPGAAPAVVFLPLGVALGPLGLQVLSKPVLAHLDTVVSIALAALGVFVGLGLDFRQRPEWRMLGAASLEALTTVVIVAAASYALLLAWQIPLGLDAPIVAFALGICASASSAGAVGLTGDHVHRVATRIADLDDVLPILAGGFVIASIADLNPMGALRLSGLAILMGLAIGLATSLLAERARDGAERVVFVVGALLLLGGSAAYLSLSPLVTGLVAGLFWTYAPGHTDELIRDDLTKIQHPLVVVLLLVAGAGIEFAPAGVWLLAPFVLFRLAGKLMGGWIAARLAPVVSPADLGAYLVAPGVIGIAFALNVQQVAGQAVGAAIVSATAAGSFVSEILALVVLPSGGRD